MRKLREYFGSLDDDGSGSIGTDELEEPLIALGLVDSRAQVDKIVMEVDDDGSGMLEFPEFLGIIKGGSNSNDDASDDGSGAIYQFFKDLTCGNMQIDGNSNIPFSLFITAMRRKKILASMQSKDERVRKDGERILNNYKKQLAERLVREAIEKGETTSQKPFSSSSRGGKSQMGSTQMTSNSNKTKNKESEEQKLIQKKLQEISTFPQGEEPDAEKLMKIVKKKTVIID